MKKTLLFFLLVLINAISHAQKEASMPMYAGHIEYTKGNFGTYNYPVKGDSILVYLKDSAINFLIFNKNISKPRTLETRTAHFKMVTRREYNNIVSIDKTVATGNYDMKFVAGNPGDHAYCNLYLGHYGDGSTAELTLTVESDKIRLYDLFVASLIKLK